MWCPPRRRASAAAAWLSLIHISTPLDQKVKQVRAQESYTTFAELPETYVDAVIAAEDHRFYQHNGIDVIAIGRAVVNDIKAMSFVEGGSTITQQLAKNLYFTQEKRLTRKAAEMFMAFHIEANYTKEEIFELYVNSIYFGSGCYDVASASQAYFGVEPSQMDANQCTLLAGIPNAPSVSYTHLDMYKRQEPPLPGGFQRLDPRPDDGLRHGRAHGPQAGGGGVTLPPPGKEYLPGARLSW